MAISEPVNIDNLEGKAEAREADANFAEKGKNADFGAAADKLKDTFYAEGHICTPEEREDNAEQFEQRYAADVEQLLGKEVSEKIAAHFEKKGDLEAAVFLAVSEMDIPDENKEDATELITEYLNPRITSKKIDSKLRSEKGVPIKAGMNAGYINAFLGSNIHLDLNPTANDLQIGDIVHINGDQTSLMKNDNVIGTLNEDEGDLNELQGAEFQESRYFPLIEKYNSSENTDPLHSISGEQIEEIGKKYAQGTDIVLVMGEVLGSNHEAVGLAKDLDNPNKIEERRSQMYQDFNVEESCKVNPSDGSGGDTVTNLISENYNRILGKNGEVDTKASLILATQISANKIIEGKHTFSKTPEFQDAYERIMLGSTSAEDLQKDLLLIHKTVNHAEGIRGKNRQLEASRVRQKAKQKSLFLEAEFQEIQALFTKNQENGDTTGMKQQEDNLTGLQKENPIVSGEVFSAGALDTANSGGESTKQTA